MANTTPEPEGRLPHSEPASAANYGPDERRPDPGGPEPHRFGPTTTDAAIPPLPGPPLAASGWQQPAPYQVVPVGPRPLPSVGIIWLNIVVFGWFLGIGLIYGIVRSIQGITRSRERGLSPNRYVVPLVFVAAVFLLLLIIGLTHASGPADGTGGQGLTPG